MNKKVSIITRAFNRLEYTIKCIDSVIKNTNYDNYEHIIINNASNDGTKEWLKWIELTKLPYFKNVKSVHLETNYGDWGGMIKAIEYVSSDSEYYMQLDNDIEIKDPEWLNKMIYLIENNYANIVQLKRVGVKTIINPQNIKHVKYKNSELIFGDINRPVACFMLKTSDFKHVLPRIKNSNFKEGKALLHKYIKNTKKITNTYAYIIDGLTENSYLNYEKYPHSCKLNNKFVIHIHK